MNKRSRMVAGSAGAAVVLMGTAACGLEGGGGTADGTLDCSSVLQLMPYSPGGGSDQAARRLQEGIEEALGVSTNIDYRTGGDGSLAWTALAEAEPDGCTVANVTTPNLQILTETTEGLGFEATDFTYVGFTDFSPFILAVAEDSRFETLQDFIDEAQERPGELTVAGNGAQGELSVREASQALDIEVTYVPVAGGHGDIIPRVAGGHIDATLTATSGIQGGQLRGLALTSPLDTMDLPTFEDEGFEPLDLATSWGLMLPPDTPDEIVEIWSEAVQSAQEEVAPQYEELFVQQLVMSADEAQAYVEEPLATIRELIAEE